MVHLGVCRGLRSGGCLRFPSGRMAVRVRRNCMVCRGGETMVAGRAALMMDAVGPGDHLDPYRIDSRVARSGMTCIFRGTDLRTGRDRASSFRGGVKPDFF